MSTPAIKQKVSHVLQKLKDLRQIYTDSSVETRDIQMRNLMDGLLLDIAIELTDAHETKISTSLPTLKRESEELIYCLKDARDTLKLFLNLLGRF